MAMACFLPDTVDTTPKVGIDTDARLRAEKRS